MSPLAGAVSEFKRKYENPILRGRDSEATDEQKKKGEEKLSEVGFKIVNAIHNKPPHSRYLFVQQWCSGLYLWFIIRMCLVRIPLQYPLKAVYQPFRSNRLTAQWPE